ncbi:efflux transporter outer membrane subunit [Lysobacter ciconiae]|uniref:Efflux transporter outer membrane subunit n=1 Tax=Novilysobacter ciconiae TaxID=2781022 RepID=A0A7S6UE19_9GAMM|nr:efflux transporter outer membrane subunit [Lysobacter ciconiae]QOW18556.1 efflux transporter outer membrane subunit [Lysobacter ciconiae]
MHKPLVTALALATSLFVSGCAMLEPRVPEVAPAIPAEWPLPPTTSADANPPATAAAQPQMDPGATPVADVGWRDFFVDPRLEQLIAQALENNRDLRVAVLNVERARSQYRIQRADRVPSLGVSAELQRTGGDAPVTDLYTAGLGIAQFELDLFGRVRSLSHAALQSYFASAESRRAAQLSLVAEVANTYLALAADQELLRVTEARLANQQAAFDLTEKRFELGALSALDVNQARTTVETARSDVARFAGQVAQDINALTLLVGDTLDPALLPTRFEPAVSGLAGLPAGLPSSVLLRRPDVMSAEHRLLAANANIGAARAAFFPSISLTGSIGSASDELSGLFKSGNGVWSFMPQINLPIFQGGRLRANLGMATADRDIALAEYEKSIQSGFREVADALALSKTLAQQRIAQEALLQAATRTNELSQARYDAGLDSYLTLLITQRTLYDAQQSLVATLLAEQANRVTLYKVLGGGWVEGQ